MVIAGIIFVIIVIFGLIDGGGHIGEISFMDGIIDNSSEAILLFDGYLMFGTNDFSELIDIFLLEVYFL